jgi:hypothetical protein
MVPARYALAPLLLLAAGVAGPTAASATEAGEAIDATDQIVTIANEGGTREGHTPTAFAGMGTGLFAGDNLNPGFPEGVGVQTYLTFALPADLVVGSASVTSDALQVSGTPFEDLGPLLAEPVAYEVFGSHVFDIAAIGPPTECSATEDGAVRCEVTEALQTAVSGGNTEAQFRIRFTTAADGDGQQDLALFFRTDSNTNEVGLFQLEVTPGP